MSRSLSSPLPSSPFRGDEAPGGFCRQTRPDCLLNVSHSRTGQRPLRQEVFSVSGRKAPRGGVEGLLSLAPFHGSSIAHATAARIWNATPDIHP